MAEHIYAAIDLKSFYASVELADMGRDALTTHLVVADPSRTEKTICLAVSPSLKEYGVPGRGRLFEVIQRVKEINQERRKYAPNGCFSGKSCDSVELKNHPELEADFLIAPPHMAKYMKISSEIYQIYLERIAPEDIHVYSIDEVFIDLTSYLTTYGKDPGALVSTLIREVEKRTGITATAGIGTNLYLAKAALDIRAKHVEPDENGVRIAVLDERSYREQLWDHRPLTDFWRVGRGYARKLEAHGLYTMGDIARCSIGKENDYHREDLLYRLFGVNAELLIDHAWGWEPCTIADVKAYKPESSSIGSGQVLPCAYDAQKARLVVQEMTDQLVLDLVSKKMVSDQCVLTVGYDIENLNGSGWNPGYRGEVTTDRYGRKIPKHAHGTVNFGTWTSSARIISEKMLELYDEIVNSSLLVRRIYLTANHVREERITEEKPVYEQLNLFTDYEALEQQKKQEKKELEKERRMQQAVLSIKQKFGKNAILKGMNLEDGATAKSRNEMIGGHKA